MWLKLTIKLHKTKRKLQMQVIILCTCITTSDPFLIVILFPIVISKNSVTSLQNVICTNLLKSNLAQSPFVLELPSRKSR